MKSLFILILGILLISFVSATSVGIQDSDITEGVVIYEEPEIPTDYSILDVHSADFWDALDTPADIEYSDVGGDSFWDANVDLGIYGLTAGNIFSDAYNSDDGHNMFDWDAGNNEIDLGHNLEGVGWNISADWFKGKYNWTSGDNWNIFDGSTLTFNETKFDAVYHNPTQALAVIGTIDGGTLEDVQHSDAKYDGTTFNFSEEVGGLDLRINFTGLSVDTFKRGIMRYKTSSLKGDFPLVQMWSYGEGVWEDYPYLVDSDTFATMTQPVFDGEDHIQDGVAQMRIYKPASGNTQNHYYVDWIAIVSGIGLPSGEEVDPIFNIWLHNASLKSNLNGSGYNLTGLGYLEIEGNLNVTGTITGEQITSTDDIDMAGTFTNVMGATDTNGIDQTLTYTGSAEASMINNIGVCDTASSNAGVYLSGMKNTITNNHIMTGSEMFVFQITQGILNTVNIDGDHTASPSALFIEQTQGIYNQVAEAPRTLSTGGTSDQVLIYGIYNEVKDSVWVDYDSAGKTLNKKFVGMYNTVTANRQTLTAGTLNLEWMGERISVLGDTTGTTNTAYGIKIDNVEGADTNWAYYNDALGVDNYMGSDNSVSKWGTTDTDLQIFSDGTNPAYNTTGVHNFYNSTGWGTVVTGKLVEMYSLFDKSQGSALDLIKDSDEYRNPDGSINHESHFSSVPIKVKDPDNCWEVIDKYCNDFGCVKEEPKNMKDYEIIYREECGTKTEYGFDVFKRIDTLEQAIYEIKTETCLKDNTWSWC